MTTPTDNRDTPLWRLAMERRLDRTTQTTVSLADKIRAQSAQLTEQRDLNAHQEAHNDWVVQNFAQQDEINTAQHGFNDGVSAALGEIRTRVTDQRGEYMGMFNTVGQTFHRVDERITHVRDADRRAWGDALAALLLVSAIAFILIKLFGPDGLSLGRQLGFATLLFGIPVAAIVYLLPRRGDAAPAQAVVAQPVAADAATPPQPAANATAPAAPPANPTQPGGDTTAVMPVTTRAGQSTVSASS